MTRVVKPSSRFKRDVALAQRRGQNLSLLQAVVKLLAEGNVLPKEYKDHPLQGRYAGCRECHIAPDWLLIYKISGTSLYLYLTRTGTHSDLFKT